MSTSILPFLSSAEVLGHVSLDVSNFANTEYAASSVQSFDYQTVAPQTQHSTFAQKHVFLPYKSESLFSNLLWECTVSALTAASPTITPDAFNYLRWRRWAPYNGIESVNLIVGNESIEKIPGYWLYLQNTAFVDAPKRQVEEVWDLSAAERDQLSRGAATFRCKLMLACLRHRGVYIGGHQLREQLRIEITTRALASWYETNIATSTIAATITSDRLFVEYTVLPAADNVEYINAVWRRPMKTMSYIERESISVSGGGYHSVTLTYGGAVEGYFIGLRNNSGGAIARGDYIRMDRVDGLSISWLVNNQNIITSQPADWFLYEAQMNYLPGAPGEQDDFYWYYIPVSLDASKMASSGLMDHNTPSSVVIRLHFTSSFTGDVTIVSPVRNELVARSGLLQKTWV